MLLRTISILFATLGVALAGDGPTMVMKAAEQAAYADTLIQSCQFDQAEHWIDQALHTARETHSGNELVRDTAGTFLGRLEIKAREFRETRKSWERTAKDARRLLASNHLESARQRVDASGAPPCDPRFRQVLDEIESRQIQVASSIRAGDKTISRSPSEALSLYVNAKSLDVEAAGVDERIADAKRRIPPHCTGCKVAKLVIYSAIAGGVGYGGLYAYREYQRQQSTVGSR